MILIELEGGTPRRFHLEFHPYITVVAGLTPEQRRELAGAINGLLNGAEVGLRANVDVEGVPRPLTFGLVSALGFTGGVDNIVEPADLPDAIVFEPEPVVEPEAVVAPPEEPEEPEEQSEEVEDTPLAATERELHDAEERIARLEAELEEASLPPSSGADTSALDDALERHRRASADAGRIRDLLSRWEADPETRAQRLQRLRSVQEAIESRLAAIREHLATPVVDTAPVEAALAELEKPQDREQELDTAKRAGELADRLDEIAADLGRLAAKPGTPRWILDQARADLEDAEGQVLAMRAQLEEGIDVRAHLARKEQHLAEVRAAWDELQKGKEAEQAALQAERERLHAEAVALLGEDPGPPVVAEALRQEKRRLEELPSPTAVLVTVLRSVGVMTAEPQALTAALEWLASQAADAERRRDEQRELATATLDLHEVAAEITAVEARDEPEINPEALKQQLAVAEAEERRAATDAEAARAELMRSSEPDHAHVERLEAELSAARSAAAAARRKVDYFTRLAAAETEIEPPPALAGPPSVADMPVPWWERGPGISNGSAVPDVDVDVSLVEGEDLEFYLLSRAAGLRSMGVGEPVPMVLNAAFDELEPDVLEVALTVLPRIAPIVQVIYLASSDALVDWARRQDEMLAAVVHIERE